MSEEEPSQKKRALKGNCNLPANAPSQARPILWYNRLEMERGPENEGGRQHGEGSFLAFRLLRGWRRPSGQHRSGRCRGSVVGPLGPPPIFPFSTSLMNHLLSWAEVRWLTGWSKIGPLKNKNFPDHSRMVSAVTIFFFLHHAMFLDQLKWVSRLVCCRVQISKKIFVKPLNLMFDFWITDLRT